MSKRAIRIPSLRAGRPVRLTFEVSADVGGENGAPAKKAPKKRYRAITARRVTPAETATSAAQPVASSATSSSAHPAVPARRAVHLQMLAAAMIMICVVTLTISRRPAPLAAADVSDVEPERLQQSPNLVPVSQGVMPAAAPTAALAIAPIVTPRPVNESTAKAAVPKSEKTRIADASSPTAAVAAIDEALAKEDASTTFPPSESISADPAPASVDPVAPGSVTVTGCLETSGNNRYQLTDTAGAEAPRSRSWRSGFLKKRSTSVALVASPDPETLRTQVGQRIAATGQLTSRELRVTSLQVLGARCD
jgi:hypothetical protein